MMSKLKFEKLTEAVIGAAIEVHREFEQLHPLHEAQLTTYQNSVRNLSDW
jgi:hypothetical protein